MTRLHKYIVVLVIIYSLTTLLSCMQVGEGHNNDKNKYAESLTRFVLYSEIINHPEMLILPYDGEYVSPDTDIRIIFSRPVNKTADWSVTVDSVVYDNLSPEIFWDSLSIGDYSFSELIIHPTNPLMRGKTITVIADGFIGFSKIGSSFTINTSYQGISITPSDYATQIAPDANVVLTFSESADESSDWNVTIDGVAYDKSSPEILWNEQHTVLTINPVGYFQRNKTILLSASGFLAAYDGSPFNSKTSRFTIMSRAYATTSPANGEKAVRANKDIVITFSEPMIPDDGWSVTADGVTYTKDSASASWSDKKTVTLVKVKDFRLLSTITAAIQGFHAASDNSAFVGPFSVSFKTGLKIENIPMNNAISTATRFSSVVDSQDKLYVSYYDRNQKYPLYITNNSGTWVNYPIDTGQDLDYHIPLAIDSEDSLLAAYPNCWGEDVRFAKYSGGIWGREIFDPSWYRGNAPSIAVDSFNTVHISYWSWYPTYDLYYATNAGGSWAINVIESTTDTYEYNSSIAVDSNNKIHISYLASNNLHYATNREGSWSTYVIDANKPTGNNSAIAIDSSSAVHIVYYDNSNPSDFCIRYATNKSGSWQRYKVSSVFFNRNRDLSICIDHQNKIYTSFTDYSQSDYRYYSILAVLESGVWNIYYIDCADFNDWLGDNASMSIDSNDALHIFYESGYSNGVLRHATTAP